MLSAEIPSTTKTTIRCSELILVTLMTCLYKTSVIGKEKRIIDIDEEVIKKLFVCQSTKI
jgi:hypothetical protein